MDEKDLYIRELEGHEKCLKEAIVKIAQAAGITQWSAEQLNGPQVLLLAEDCAQMFQKPPTE